MGGTNRDIIQVSRWMFLFNFPSPHANSAIHSLIDNEFIQYYIRVLDGYN